MSSKNSSCKPVTDGKFALTVVLLELQGRSQHLWPEELTVMTRVETKVRSGATHSQRHYWNGISTINHFLVKQNWEGKVPCCVSVAMKKTLPFRWTFRDQPKFRWTFRIIRKVFRKKLTLRLLYNHLFLPFFGRGLLKVVYWKLLFFWNYFIIFYVFKFINFFCFIYFFVNSKKKKIKKKKFWLYWFLFTIYRKLFSMVKTWVKTLFDI